MYIKSYKSYKRKGWKYDTVTRALSNSQEMKKSRGSSRLRSLTWLAQWNRNEQYTQGQTLE